MRFQGRRFRGAGVLDLLWHGQVLSHLTLEQHHGEKSTWWTLLPVKSGPIICKKPLTGASNGSVQQLHLFTFDCFFPLTFKCSHLIWRRFLNCPLQSVIFELKCFLGDPVVRLNWALPRTESSQTWDYFELGVFTRLPVNGWLTQWSSQWPLGPMSSPWWNHDKRNKNDDNNEHDDIMSKWIKTIMMTIQGRTLGRWSSLAVAKAMLGSFITIAFAGDIILTIIIKIMMKIINNHHHHQDNDENHK